MTTTPAAAVSMLAGRIVTKWQGTEMALAEGQAAGGIRWEDPCVPFLQLVNLDFQLLDGLALRLSSRLDDGTGFHGLYLAELDGLPVLDAPDDPLSIYRARPLSGLPIGEIEIAELRRDGPNATVEIRLIISSSEIRLVAGEVYEQGDGTLRIVEPDESILLQVNGMLPAKH